MLQRDSNTLQQEGATAGSRLTTDQAASVASTRAAEIAALSLEAVSERRISAGDVSFALNLARGDIEASYPQSNGEPLGTEVHIEAARGGRKAELAISKLRSGSICHDLSIELDSKQKGNRGKQSAVVRTASLYFPTNVVSDPVAQFLTFTARHDTVPGRSASFDLLQLCDAGGKPLAHNLLNVLESSAERWRELFRFGQRPSRFSVTAEHQGDGAVKLDFESTADSGRGASTTRRTTYFLTENRLLTGAEYRAVTDIYSMVPAELGKEYFQWFRGQQFLAWLWRKHLEPGGENHPGTQDLAQVKEHGLEALFFRANGLGSQDEHTFVFVSRLSIEVLENIRSLGAPHLQAMRDAGERLLTCGTMLDKGEFTAFNVLYGVPCFGSDPAHLDPLLVLTGANLHHEGWMRAHEWMNARDASELRLDSRVDHQPYAMDTISPFWIRDCGNFYGLSFLLGSMTVDKFAPILDSAAPEPALLPLDRTAIPRLLGLTRSEDATLT